jgi:hypothetical protein
MIKFLQDNYPQCLPTRRDAVTLNAGSTAAEEPVQDVRERLLLR